MDTRYFSNYYPIFSKNFFFLFPEMTISFSGCKYTTVFDIVKCKLKNFYFIFITCFFKGDKGNISFDSTKNIFIFYLHRAFNCPFKELRGGKSTHFCIRVNSWVYIFYIECVTHLKMSLINFYDMAVNGITCPFIWVDLVSIKSII